MVLKHRKTSLFVLVVGLGILVNPLNSSMIAVGLNRLQSEFSLTFADATWLISIFYLASATAQPIMGKLSDLFGPKRLFLGGLVIVGVSSALAAFSVNYTFLLVCRAIQAIGSSTLFPSGMSMVRKSITKKQGKVLAILSTFASTSAALGPTIGGVLINSWDWQAIFMINLPLVILTFIMAIYILPNKDQSKFKMGRIDFIGTVLFVLTMTGLILFLLSLEGNISWWPLIMFLISAVLFYFYEAKQKDPFIDVIALKNNYGVSLLYLQYIGINLIFYSFIFGLPSFLQIVYSYSEQQTGLIMLTLAGSATVIVPIVGSMIDRHGSKLPILIGTTVLLAGTALMLSYNAGSPLIWLITIMIIIGVSVGFNNISMQSYLYELVTPEIVGSASGLFQTSRYIGAILASSLLGLTFGDGEAIGFYQLKIIVLVTILISVLVLLLNYRMISKYKASVNNEV